jgi:hypothetical protein
MGATVHQTTVTASYKRICRVPLFRFQATIFSLEVSVRASEIGTSEMRIVVTLVKFAALCTCYAAVPHANADAAAGAGEFLYVPSPDYVSVPPLIWQEPYSSADVQPYAPPTVRTYPAPVVYEPPPEVYGPPPAIYGYGYGVTRVRPHWREHAPHKKPNNGQRPWSASD